MLYIEECKICAKLLNFKRIHQPIDGVDKNGTNFAVLVVR